MNRILEVDFENRRVVVESGVVNLHVTNAVKARGYFYAPDPSSQVACTIGGNIAENSGGPHTLKYGVTTNHVLALELVMPDGEVVELGGPAEERCGYDLVGAVVGAEGTTGIVTRATLKLMREPESHRTLLAAFPDADSATRAVSAIIYREVEGRRSAWRAELLGTVARESGAGLSRRSRAASGKAGASLCAGGNRH